jgi:hypothetical protein
VVVAVAVPQDDEVGKRSQAGPAPSIIGDDLEYYAGIDVSLESASLCVVDATGRIMHEARVASEPQEGMAPGNFTTSVRHREDHRVAFLAPMQDDETSA